MESNVPTKHHTICYPHILTLATWGLLFYLHDGGMSPHLLFQPLFKNTDMEKQGQKLMKVLGICVTTLRNMDALVPLLEKLGRKHVSYGVKPNMYPSVARALLITMEKALGEECKPMTKDAWQWILELISKICIDAANEFEAEQAKPQVEPTPVEEQPANA